MNVLFLPTEQDNVILKQLTLEDAPAYFEAVDANRDHLSQFGDETAANYPDLDSVATSITNPKDTSKLRFGIWDGEKFVGSVNLTPRGDKTEVGYWLDAREQGHGYATIAARAVARYGKERYGDLFARVSAEQTDEGVRVNERSVRVLQRTGFHETAKEIGKLTFDLELDELLPDPSFDEQLEYAFRYPRIVNLGERSGISPQEVAEREEYYGRQRSLPDTHPVRLDYYEQDEHEAVTLDPEMYPLLLAQAMRHLEITNGAPDPGVKVTPKIEKAANHEIAHARMGEKLGVASAFIARVLHDPENDIWVIGPSHALIGPATITKLESAAISAAPEDAKQGDLLSIRAAGYTSREEVLEKFYAAHPDIAS